MRGDTVYLVTPAVRTLACILLCQPSIAGQFVRPKGMKLSGAGTPMSQVIETLVQFSTYSTCN